MTKAEYKKPEFLIVEPDYNYSTLNNISKQLD